MTPAPEIIEKLYGGVPPVTGIVTLSPPKTVLLKMPAISGVGGGGGVGVGVGAGAEAGMGAGIGDGVELGDGFGVELEV